MISVNDPFVMDSWISSYGENNINYIADPNGDFIKETGLELDLSSIGLGVRLSRFVMLINNCEIKKILTKKVVGLTKVGRQRIRIYLTYCFISRHQINLFINFIAAMTFYPFPLNRKIC